MMKQMILNERQKRRKELILIYGVCFLLAFLFLMTCSANSFLYAFNDWVDFNWYRTMGRGILEGKVIYRDIFDHKGPLIYLIFAVVEMFSNPPIVVFFIEVITFSLFLFLAYKYLSKYLNDLLSMLGVVILAFLIPSSLFFNAGGGAVEEYVLPIFMYFFLIFDDYLSGKSITRCNAIIIGLFIGLMFWIKFSMLVVSGIMLIIWFIMNLIKKQYKETFLTVLWMILGFIIATIPVIIYFGINNAFFNLWEGYFYVNLFRYDNAGGLISLLIDFFGSGLVVGILVFIVICSLFFLALLLFFKSKKAFLLIIPFIVQLLLFILLKSLPLTYYFLILIPYLVYGLFSLLKLLKKQPETKKYKILTFVLTTCLLFGLSFLTCNNTQDLGKKRDEYVQYQVANKINEYGINNATLFCYSMWDFGFYNALEVVPVEKYYARSNFSQKAFPEMYEAFDNAIIEARSDFVVVIEQDYNNKQSMFDTTYNVIASYTSVVYENDFNFREVTFMLLKKI